LPVAVTPVSKLNGVLKSMVALVAPAIVIEVSVTAPDAELVVDEGVEVELAKLEDVVPPHAAKIKANVVNGSHFCILFIIFFPFMMSHQ
jgi:hypothetical protein